MILKDLKIGDTFRRCPKGIIYKKDTNQGMHDLYASITTVETYNTRCWRPSKRSSVILQTTIIFPV